ncbi:hypothetical protein RIF29_25335 [Crotalaria pallida]|uniref:Uncharacterized protein n=1 Tax=Crotalaria pallida TaxID=3830 RepID=A0AAN9ELY7_CROPI
MPDHHRCSVFPLLVFVQGPPYFVLIREAKRSSSSWSAFVHSISVLTTTSPCYDQGFKSAARALDVLNFTPLNNKAIRIMYSHRDPSIRKSGTANIFIKRFRTCP